MTNKPTITNTEAVSVACAEIWNAMRSVGGPFWAELAERHRALAIECYKAGNLAALSRRAANSAGGVEVKALDWAKHPVAEAWRADTMLGTYQVWIGSLATSWQFDSLLGESINEKSGSADEAKAAAQADFNQRILSAIAHAVEAEPVAWRWRWAETGDWYYGKNKPERIDADHMQSVDALFTHPSSPVSAEVTVTDEMVFAAMAKADELGEPLDDIDAREILSAGLAALNGKE